MTELSTETPIEPTAKPNEDKCPRPKSNIAQIISAVFACLGFILSVCVFGVVIYQVLLIKDNARTVAARQVYMSYSEAALKNPELVEPDFLSLKNNPKEYVRYKRQATAWT
jgi:hypothetical protein